MTTSLSTSGSRPAIGVGGRIFATLFFLVFFGMGAIFVWLIARDAMAGLQTWTWTRTQCQIIQSRVRDTDQRGRRTSDYRLDVAYQYTFNGQSFNSSRQRLRPASFSDYGKVERLAASYRASSETSCYVNPHDPTQAVLERGSLLFPFIVLFPLIFVAIGGIGMFSVWRPATAAQARPKPISDNAIGRFGPAFATVFFGVFIVIGLVAFYFISVRPLSEMLAARNWPAVPCTVVSSEVVTHRGNRGSTYSVNILYEYAFNNRQYKANRYDFMGGSSSGYAGKQAIVGQHPPRSQTSCFVNPGDPTQAVLIRGFTPLMWIGLLPLLFVVLGFFGAISSWRKARLQPLYGAAETGGSPRFGRMDAIPRIMDDDARASIILKPRSSPLGKVVGTTLCALFWNGIISVFVFHLVKSWRAGVMDIFLGLFLIPFVLIGMGLIVLTGYFFLALFNPRPRVTVSPGAPRLGELVRLDWDVTGRIEVLQNFQLRLEGREEATYRRGTRSATDRNIFANLEVASLTAPQEIRNGSATVTIPTSLMHSFASQHNKIVWSLQVSGEIARWPDLNEEFEFTVLPAKENGLVGI